MARKKEKQTADTVLAAARETLQGKGYAIGKPHSIEEGLGYLYEDNKGNPLLLLCAVDPDVPIDQHQNELAVLAGLTTCGNTPPPFVHLTNGTDASTFRLTKEGERAVPELPPAQEALEKAEVRFAKAADPNLLKRYEALQRRFDDIHEHIYATRENVNSSNEAIDELCKLVYMVNVLQRYQAREKPLFIDSVKKQLSEILDPARFADTLSPSERKKAVEEIRLAFDTCRELEEFNHNADGEEMRIFEDRAYLRLESPTTYSMALSALMDLKPDGTNGGSLSEVGDITGRALDVVLRRKFEGKGGMGAYLTPSQITRFMAQMVFVDLKREDRLKDLLQMDDRGRPTFRFCDPFLGSAGFLIHLIDQVRNYVNTLVAFDKERRQALYNKILDHCFIGADNSPGMILKARINLAAHGNAHASARRLPNSLTDPWLDARAGTVDVILTNPPFKKNGITRKASKSRKRGEDEPISGEAGAGILDAFMEGISKGGVQSIDPNKRCLGAKPNKKGKWKPVNSMDPAVLAIDRCLQLLKPGGKLLIVVPDGILCNSSYRYVREYLIGVKDEGTGEFSGGKAILKAVVSFPQETFSLSGGGAKTSMLYLEKKRSPTDRQGTVFMAVANEVGFTVKNKVEIQLGEGRNDLNRVLDAYEAGPV